MNKTYTDKHVTQSVFERIFDLKDDNEELTWHTHDCSRFIKVLEGSGWKVQFDNELPKDIIPGTTIHINKNSYHRLLRGHSELVVRIVEL